MAKCDSANAVDMLNLLSPHLDLYRAALLYLDRTKSLSYISSISQFYTTVQDKAFYFTLDIDVAELTEISVTLGNFLLDNPNGTAKLFQEVIFAAVKAKDLLPKCTSQSQVVVNFKLKALPKLPGYELSCSADLLKYADKKRFLQYQGVVTGISILHKYTKSARFVCPQSECSGSEGNKYIRLHVAGARETQTIRGDFKCTFCGSALEEDISCRLLADKKIVEVVDNCAFGDDNFKQNRFQAIALHIRDELVDDIDIGEKLNVVGIPVLDLYNNTLALEVNNILKLSDFDINESENNIPVSILKLYQDRRNSPWSFALSLAYAFGSEICSAGTFIHLKLGMLLSLVGSNSKDSSLLDLLAVSCDTILLDRLLRFGAELSERSVVHSYNHHLTAAVTKDRHQNGAAFIEGGSILLAGTGGVCVVPDINDVKKQTKYSLLQVMESNSVFVDVSAKTSKQSSQQLFLPRRCSIWGYSKPEDTKKMKQSDVLISTVDQEHVTEEIASAFGQVYFCEVKADSYAECVLVNQSLTTAMSCSPQPLIEKEHLKQFICHTRKQSVSFTVEAERLIRGYYVASRRVRSSSCNTITLPVTAVKTITTMAQAHAKLSLREQVTEFDAAIAILLYEEQITCRTGFSVIHVQPVVHLPDNNIHQHLGPQLDKDILQFYQVLKHFLATHASEIDSHMEE